MAPPTPVPRLSPQDERRRRKRSIAIALVLVGLIALLYAITLAKGPQILNRPM